MNEGTVPMEDKIAALKRVAKYRPAFTTFIIIFSFFATLLEGIGLTFLLPVIKVAQSSGTPVEDSGSIVGVFFQAYSVLGLPFTLEYIILGLIGVMTVRYSATFLAGWLAITLSKEYEQHFKLRAFESALAARIAYYDEKGSDEILNAIITQTRYAGRVINTIVKFMQQVLLSLMYTAVALYVAPLLLVLAMAILGGITYLVRRVLEPGYTVGDRVAQANEQVQRYTQAGTQGIREIKLFGVTEDILAGFRKSVATYIDSSIVLERNELGIQNLYKLLTAVMLFGLLYVAISVLSLTIAALGVFLFAMFRLAPRISTLNSRFYDIEGDLPHLVRTQQFVDRLENHAEDRSGTEPVPDRITTVAFDDVSFAYTEEEQVLRNVALAVEQGEFVGFVGQSGAGKSTIVSLLARMYDPDSGRITVNGTSIHEFDIREWRTKIAMVRQNPFIFNDTLRYNITLGDPVAEAALQEVADIAQVTEFLADLPQGYDTTLGDDGVKLSGGQRQRVALARALLADAELLILDEATSDLDSNLEQQIHASIEALDDDRTIFAIAHRLSTVQSADCIYTVEDGEITETGTHEELVENNGKYAELYAIQS